ncbi:MAG: 50S ribosomal protein L13 [Anaerolineales bacterium]|nr:50S ribosomal protein L13 [Anaerolineales bacterium]MCB0017523.1 50S ribosomal protein L13 [Anaerolineales bacterium]MCB0029780.1 50S ribosomal protein L13 [Anaerolineales bacterium]
MDMKTFVTKPAEVDRKWYVVDADGQTLGRLATKLAETLRGKHKTIYSPSVDCGDYVIVINAEKIAVTGNRMDDKMYHRHSGYPGGLTSVTLRRLLETYPERAIQSAVKGMLPKNSLGRQMLKKMKVYAGTEHPHQAQQPETLEL